MSKTFSAYGGKQSEPQEPERRSTECMSYGCPLPATFSTQMRGSNFMCRAHDGTPAHEWPAITERVKQVERAFFAAIDMTNEPAGDKPDPRTVAKFVALSPDFAASGNLSARTYGAFALGKLLEKVRPKHVPPHIPSYKTEGLRKVDIVL